MKKILSIILCLAVVACLAACSDNQPDNNPTDSSDTSTTQAPDSSALPVEYETILNNIAAAFPWDSEDSDIVPENPELSYMYRQSDELSDIGYALIDLDGNGQNELVINAIESPYVYDLYTISEGKAVHIFASGERYAHFLLENGYVELQWSDSAAKSGHDFYKFNDGQLELVERITLDAEHALNVGIINDLAEANDSNCYFISSTDKTADYVSVSAEEANEKIESYQNANPKLNIEYTLLSELNK